METDYLIDKQSKTEYLIHKFVWGGKTDTYKISKKNGKVLCGCMSGIYRGYCKHKDWVGLLEQGKKLPENVEVTKSITRKDLIKMFK